MAKQEQQAGEGLTDQQQAAMVQLGKMMGPHAGDFDSAVQELHSKRHQAEHDADDGTYGHGDVGPHEAGYEKEKSALSGGSLGPSDIDKEQVQQQQAQSQRLAGQQAAQAQQAQGAQSPVNAPPAPTGPVGVSTPFEAQKTPQPPPGAEDVEPEVPGMQSPASQVQPPPAPDQGDGGPGQ